MSGIRIQTRFTRDGFDLEVDLAIPAQGVTAILGPSGSGKSTLLRLIAGLEKPRCGCMQMGNVIWQDSSAGICLPPQERGLGMVFQDYALFEHMTVWQNIAYGMEKHDRQPAIRYWLDSFGLTGLEQRYPSQLSGGQRQRVALARALAPKPDMLLLDEPLSAVDAYMRQELRQQIKQLINNLRQPVLMITHDLDDVRQMADYVGIMIDGKITRFGPVIDVFDRPGSLEVARVLGWSNFLFVSRIQNNLVNGNWGSLELAQEPPIDTFCLAMRPEHVRLASSAGVRAQVKQILELGAVREVACRLQDGRFIKLHRPWNEPLPAVGTTVYLQFPEQHCQCLPESGQAVSLAATRGHDAETPKYKCV